MNSNRGGRPINKGNFVSNNKMPKRTNYNNPQQNLPSKLSSYEYDIPTISELLKKSEKNPIALLHEYCAKIKKNITYQYDAHGDNFKKTNYICSIMIDDVGIIARGSGNTKKEAKSSAGDKALNYLITTDPKSRLILGELLERQVKNTQNTQNTGLEANINIQKQNPNLLQQNNMIQNNYVGTSNFFNVNNLESNVVNQE